MVNENEGKVYVRYETRPFPALGYEEMGPEVTGEIEADIDIDAITGKSVRRTTVTDPLQRGLQGIKTIVTAPANIIRDATSGIEDGFNSAIQAIPKVVPPAPGDVVAHALNVGTVAAKTGMDSVKTIAETPVKTTSDIARRTQGNIADALDSLQRGVSEVSENVTGAQKKLLIFALSRAP